MKETLVSQFFVAGLIFSNYADAPLKRGTRLTLIKAPNNFHDHNAIKILTTNQKVWIGYVPRDLTHKVSDFAGRVTRAVVHAYEPANVTHRRVLVNVYGIPQNPEEANTICS